MEFTNEKQGFQPDGFLVHLESLNQALEPLSSLEILQALLKKIKPVDFRLEANLGEKGKLQNMHRVVIVIEKVLELAKENQWGICKKNDFIYIYNGTFWNRINEEELQDFLGEAAEKMSVDPIQSKYFTFKEHLLNQFLSTANIPTPDQAFESTLVNLRNGTFEICESGTSLRGFHREDFLKYQLPFDYNPEAVCPLFDAYLDRVLPTKELQEIIMEYLGSLFIRPKILKLEKVLLLYGSGANGKSVFFDIVYALLGRENCSSYSLQSLTRIDGYQRAELANKLVNYASEISGNLETELFKQLVSGEPVEARQIYGSPFTMEDYAKLIFNCNNLPKEVEHSNAYFRRLLIVPFDVTIPEEDQDPQLAQKVIEKELAGVFNRVLSGLKRLLKQKRFTDSQLVKKNVERYRKESDTVLLFLEDKEYRPDPTEKRTIQSSVMYREYQEYCCINGFKALNNSNFRRRMEQSRFLYKRINSGMVICCLEEYEVEEESSLEKESM